MVLNRGPVGPRVPKEEFMRALGLDHENTDHESYYRAMRVCGISHLYHAPGS